MEQILLELVTQTNGCSLTDDGSIIGKWAYIDGDVWGRSYNNISTIEEKKNVKQYKKSGIDEVLKTDIYNYKYKNDTSNKKTRIGTIIGKEYSISEDIISNDKKGIDLYAMVSIAYKAIQEQQEIIENLKEKDKQKDELIADLIKRVEALEKGENINGK